jgi:spermidine synthase
MTPAWGTVTKAGRSGASRSTLVAGHHARSGPPLPGDPHRGRWLFALGLAAALCSAGVSHAAAASGSRGTRPPRARATLELDVQSAFSHIRVYKQGNVYSLIFVRDNGDEAVQTMINMRIPHELMSAYARFMFASYLFLPKQERVLIVGLGGGAMIHFCQRYDPELRVDAVEIDPAVVKIAEKYFKTRSTKNVNIVTGDGLSYLEKTKTQYDVIYMDAFLKPSPATDPTGAPRRMKTIQFYKNVQQKLKPEGLVVFNLNTSAALEEDLRTIRGAFPQVYVFRVEGGNVVVIGSRSETREKLSVLQNRAIEIDRRFKASLSFQQMLRQLEP